ncbi:hypothetical protein, partial [Enterobacter hormaechei]|uniref:hypothetical protein n=1 Tax=Enterobacter hormaechei TaxID=158836 RepID=UPI001954DCB2
MRREPLLMAIGAGASALSAPCLDEPLLLFAPLPAALAAATERRLEAPILVAGRVDIGHDTAAAVP